jgi:hypothetical protein
MSTAQVTRQLGRLVLTLVLMGAVLVVLAGCKQRQEDNPFLGPTGGDRGKPFG